MAHEVFISHSSLDKPVADAVCAALEKHRDPLLDRSTGCAARALVCRRDYTGNPAQQGNGADFLSAFEYFGVLVGTSEKIL